MNKQDFLKLSKDKMYEEYSKLLQQNINLFAENAVLKAKQEQQEEMNKLLISKVRVLKKQ